MDDAEKLIEVQAHVVAKSALDGCLENFERGARNVEREMMLLTSLAVMSMAILGLLLWGVTGTGGPGWQQYAMIAGYVAVAVLTLVIFIAAANVRRDLGHEIAIIQRHADAQGEAIRIGSE